MISIHALREEDGIGWVFAGKWELISIHALREEDGAGVFIRKAQE